MLEIVDLTYRIGARSLFEGANAFLAQGWKVGLIGRNGTGKSTLLKIILDELNKPAGHIKLAKQAKVGFVAQEAPPTDATIIEFVLEADTERHALLTEAETATDPDRIAAIYERLSDIDAYSAESRAAEILVGLGFEQDDLSRSCGAFSGGWRMRAALAGVLFSTPELLILDEPTNYLDLEGAAWLEAYLKKYPHTVLVVSHDREMLNRSVTHILALVDKKLEVHPGGYDNFLKKRAERATSAVQQKAKQDAERARLQAFVDRFKAKASKAKQAQSRVKMLEKMQDITVPLADRAMPFQFAGPEEIPSPLITLDDADLGYIEGKPVLRQVSFRLDPDDRIAIIGPNGQGKSTLVKSLAAKIALLDGKRVASRDVRVGYFSQDQLDELRRGETVLDHVRDLVPKANTAQQRALAARFGFDHEKIDTKVENLSGGEKVRLLLGIAAYHKPHVLILDEPTSHLDIDSREALIHALNEYSGAVLLITHDVYLAEACVDRLWLVHHGRARPYEGDLNSYRALVLAADRPAPGKQDQKQERSAPAAEPKSSKPAAATSDGNAAKRPSASTLRHKLSEIEKSMADLQAKLDTLDQRLADPGLFATDAKKARDLTVERARVAEKLAAEEVTWMGLQESLESLN